MRRLTARLVFVSWLLVSVPGPAAFGQVVGAIISGTITDPSGAVIPNARVTLRNLSTSAAVRPRSAPTPGRRAGRPPNRPPPANRLPIASGPRRHALQVNPVLFMGRERHTPQLQPPTCMRPKQLRHTRTHSNLFQKHFCPLQAHLDLQVLVSRLGRRDPRL